MVGRNKAKADATFVVGGVPARAAAHRRRFFCPIHRFEFSARGIAGIYVRITPSQPFEALRYVSSISSLQYLMQAGQYKGTLCRTVLNSDPHRYMSKFLLTHVCAILGPDQNSSVLVKSDTRNVTLVKGEAQWTDSCHEPLTDSCPDAADQYGYSSAP